MLYSHSDLPDSQDRWTNWDMDVYIFILNRQSEYYNSLILSRLFLNINPLLHIICFVPYSRSQNKRLFLWDWTRGKRGGATFIKIPSFLVTSSELVTLTGFIFAFPLWRAWQGGRQGRSLVWTCTGAISGDPCRPAGIYLKYLPPSWLVDWWDGEWQVISRVYPSRCCIPGRVHPVDNGFLVSQEYDPRSVHTRISWLFREYVYTVEEGVFLPVTLILVQVPCSLFLVSRFDKVKILPKKGGDINAERYGST